MKDFIINPDKEYAQKIIEGIYKKDGHCHCRVVQNESTLCPCDEFINDKICRCKLYVEVENV